MDPSGDATSDKDTTQPTTAPTLDEVNDRAQQQLANEGDSDNDQDTTEDEDQQDEDSTGTDDGQAGESADDDKDEDNEDADTATATTDTAPEKPSEPTTELDADTTKPGDGKVAINSFDGKTHYFNNWDEVPKDFEPASYKEWGVFTGDMNRKLDKETARAEQTAVEAQTAKDQERIDEINAGWTEEEAALTANGTLPKDEKARQAIINETYEYMGKYLKKGITIDSFQVALKANQYEKMKAKEVEDQKATNDMKKRRGGMVQGGTPTPSTGSTKPLIREGVPRGVTLDQIHAKHSLGVS